MRNFRRATKGINPHFEKELSLMLAGSKKLAWFCSACYHDTQWPGRVWDFYVNEGALVKQVVNFTYRNRRHQHIFFCLPGQEGRIERLKQLIDGPDYEHGDPRLINQEHEIGELLGYTAEEVDEWIDHFGMRKKFETNHIPEYHTNRELEWMLAGKKPLTAFCDSFEEFEGKAWVVDWQDAAFEPYVAEGRFTRHEFFSQMPDDPRYFQHELYFTLPGEAWRVEEYRHIHWGSHWKTYHSNRPLYQARSMELLGYSQSYINDRAIGWSRCTEEEFAEAMKVLPSLRRADEKIVVEAQTLED